MSRGRAPEATGDPDAPVPLETKTYHFSVEGTRPVLQIDLASETPASAAPVEREHLTIELHSPQSGEIFEARTSNGRLEVDRDGRIMYFCQAPDKAGFTLFLGRSVTLTMSRKTGEVIVQSPSKMLEVIKGSRQVAADLGNAPSTDSVRIILG